MGQNKLTVMIVDDEELSRKFLLNSLEAPELNLDIIAEADSGLEALSILEDQTPDVVFTDIKMPYMDGLELSQLILKKYPHIKIVILTAFKDFDYAQKSIRIGVTHFLLKPINRMELQNTITTLNERVQAERRQWEELDEMKALLKNNYQILRERFLLDILENKASNTLSESHIAYYYPDGMPSYIQVTLLEIYPIKNNSITEEQLLLQDMKNLQFVRNYLKNDSRLEFFTDQSHHLILLSYSPDIRMASLGEQLQRAIHQTSGLEVFLGIGNGYSDFYQLGHSYQEGLDALKFGRHTPNQTITIYEDDLHVENNTWHPAENFITDLQFYIKAGLLPELDKLLAVLYLDNSGNLLDLDHARILSITLLSTALNVINDLGLPMHELYEQIYNCFPALWEEDNCSSIRNLTNSRLKNITRTIADYRSDKSKSILWDILQYVRTEMSNPALNLSGVAEKFHMNESYLSRTLKKELGFGFSKYLNRLRMEYALQLINSTDMKAYQIAEAVGIPDAYYFSNCFKKYTGKSIREYKNKV